MRALAASERGPIENCRVIELPIPDPGPGEVRVRIVSAALNPADAKTILGKTGMLHAKGFPLVMGYDLSGVVDAVGSGVDLPVGTEVFGMLAYGRRTRFGTLAEFTILPAAWLAKKPATIDHDTAAALATAGLTALQGLRGSGCMKTGDRVLVTGASGGVGALVIGVAHALGGKADAITSKGGTDLAQALGAESVVDRADPHFLKALRGPYAIVYDAAAAYSMRAFRHVIAVGGTYVTTLPKLALVGDFLTSPLLRRRVRMVMVKPSRNDLASLAQFMGGGMKVPLAARVPLENAAAALADYDQHGARGKVVIRIG